MLVREARIYDMPEIENLRRLWFTANQVTYYERPGMEWLVAEEENKVYACLGYVMSPEYKQYHLTDCYRLTGRKGTRGMSMLYEFLESIADAVDYAVVLHIHPDNQGLQVAAWNRGYDMLEVNM